MVFSSFSLALRDLMRPALLARVLLPFLGLLAVSAGLGVAWGGEAVHQLRAWLGDWAWVEAVHRTLQAWFGPMPWLAQFAGGILGGCCC